MLDALLDVLGDVWPPLAWAFALAFLVRALEDWLSS